jgi:hypothetical protein
VWGRGIQIIDEKALEIKPTILFGFDNVCIKMKSSPLKLVYG